MIIKIIIYGGLSGITVLIGGLLSKFFNHHMKESPIKQEITHTLMSFGSGVMLSALALVLIPKGMAKLDLVPLTIAFLLGSVIFMYIDRYLANKGGQIAMLLAMMMDFVPESIALGAVFAIEPQTAALLAFFIGLQNLPEAFNAYRDLVLSGFKPTKTLIIFFFLSFAGIIGAFIGHFVLSNGGILYLLVQDIIPESKMEKKYLVSIGATIGFLIGIIGNKVA